MSCHDTFLQLVRLAIGHYADRISGEIDWISIEALAEQQGLYAIVLDGVEKLPANQRPPQELLLEWIGEVLQAYEYRYHAYCNTLAELSALYNSNGIKMMVLKGYACAMDWPKPEHRPYGDIDIWLFGKYKEADALLKQCGIKIDDGLHHHTIFTYKDEIVENHFDFVNVHSSKKNKEIEGIFKTLASDDSYKVTINEQTIYLPSPNLHALFLLKHAKGHFVSTSLDFRQVLDWGFFVKNKKKQIDWDWLLPLLDKYHLREFFNYMNAICVEDLGFDSKCFPYVQFNPQMKDQMLGDIFNPEFADDAPKWFISRVVFKYRRWKANTWKRRMCNENNDLYIFVRSIWKHLLKPASI